MLSIMSICLVYYEYIVRILVIVLVYIISILSLYCSPPFLAASVPDDRAGARLRALPGRDNARGVVAPTDLSGERHHAVRFCWGRTAQGLLYWDMTLIIY